MKKKLLALATTIMTLLMMTVAGFAADGNGEVDWERGVVTAKGYGVPNTKFRLPGQAKLAAREAAKASAYAELLATIKGINVEENTTVENFTIENQTINTNVQGVVKGARIVNEGWEEADIYFVEMEVPMYGVNMKSVAGAVLKRPSNRESFPEPIPSIQPSMPTTTTTTTTTTTVTTPNFPSITTTPTAPNPPSTSSTPIYTQPASAAIGGYTGVIIDCRGLGLNPVMSPVIKNDQGQPIYGYKNLDYDKVIEIGMAGYAYDLNSSAAARAGNNPLLLKAIKLDNHKSNPIISTADANRLLIENQSTRFLDNLNVVFLR